VTNILQNAEQATATGTKPEVTVCDVGGALEIAVRDFGAGVPPGDAEKIFTPFYTTRTNRGFANLCPKRSRTTGIRWSP
jgi:signal transduction histidine kinase